MPGDVVAEEVQLLAAKLAFGQVDDKSVLL